MKMDYFDCHADTLTKIPLSETLGKNSCSLDLERVLGFSGRYAQIFALWKDKGQVLEGQEEEAFMQMYQRAVSLLQGQADVMVWCQTAADMEQAHQAGKAAAFLSVEDISLMGSLAAQIRELGIRFALLSWNYENSYACGAVACQDQGLTQAGRTLVGQLVQNQVVLDISHLSDQGVEDVFAITGKPVMASHSNVRSVCSHPRNLEKRHIQELIRRRGLMGINFYRQFVGSGTGLSGLVRHIDAVLELGGEDILAIGSDFDGCSEFPQGILGVQSLPYIQDVFARAGFGSKLLEKLFFENARRFILENVH